MVVGMVMAGTRFTKFFSVSGTCKLYVFNTFKPHNPFCQITNFSNIPIDNDNFHTVFVCHVNVHACVDFISEAVLNFGEVFHYPSVVMIVDDCNDTNPLTFH